ncbi:class I SAM-dependent methyltransferase [Vibrio barjaei]|uniref:class I SAM-dependent methyltransferase n=1 Tax=Vibrio barjaei TaxID=1676683 RepID=UPI002284BB1A|nr:hypothetical protein [Vibrio barjaei]
MNMKLHSVFEQHKGKASDKWSLYLDVYNHEFSRFIDKDPSILEIGVQNGGSLEIWDDFLSPKKIVGCDINPKCNELEYSNSNIKLLVQDINLDSSLLFVKEELPDGIDLLIDDGSHTSSDIITTFSKYFPLLNDGGLFVVEDLHCSYWNEFEGGLYDPYSSMSFLKTLADLVNYEHWGVSKKTRVDLLNDFAKKYQISFDESTLSGIHSVRFYNSICIVEKNKYASNELGQRRVTGESQAVISLEHVGSSAVAYNQDNNKWSILKSSPESQYESMQEQIQELQKQVQEFQEQTQNLDGKIVDIENHNSQLQQEISLFRSSLLGKLYKLIYK